MLPLSCAGFLEVVLDRRLFQDDNRGLGQGVTDNKVTPSNFLLVLENFSKTQVDHMSLFSSAIFTQVVHMLNMYV